MKFIVWLKRYQGDLFFIGLLVLLGVLSHQAWFYFGSVLSFSDIWFQHLSTLRESLITHTWISNVNFGSPNIQLYKLLFTIPWGILASFGVPFSDALRITHLIPTAILGFISPYFLFSSFFREKFPAFVGAVFYGSATPFLIRQYQGHASIAFIIALFPFIFWVFSQTIKKNTWFYWTVFSLLYFVGVCYEVRMMYVVTFLFAFYFFLFREHSIRSYIPKILFSLILFLGMSAFWIVPFLFGNFSGAIENIIARDLFGNAHFSIVRSLALFQPYWTGDSPLIFQLQPILWYFWIIPALVFIFFFFRSEEKYKKKLHFFAFIALVGLLLTKQVGEPLPNIFQWLRENIPGFLAFRSGSKFWFLLTFGYAGILVYGLSYLKKQASHFFHIFHKIFFIVSSVLILGVSLWHLHPVVKNEFGGMFDTREIPQDYLDFASFLERETEFSRVLWLPVDSRWSYYSSVHPKLSGITLLDQFFHRFAPLNHSPTDPVQKTFEKMFRLDSLNPVLDNLSVKYIVVPIRDQGNDDDFFLSYGGKVDPDVRLWYIEELKKLPWLHLIDLGLEDLVVFENTGMKPRMYTPKTLTYTQSHFAPFAVDYGGDFLSEKTFLFEDHEYLVEYIQNSILPVEGNQEKIHNLQAEIYKERDSKIKKTLQSDLDWYRGGYFFQDYILQVPQSQKYTIFIQPESLISRISDIRMSLGDTILTQQKSLKNIIDSQWLPFQQVQLEAGTYPFRVFAGREQIDTIHQHDIVFVAENIVEPIKSPQISWQSVNPTEYQIDIRGATQSFPLIFSESYNEGWTLSLFSDLDQDGSDENLFRERHFLVNNFANAWWIDVSELEKKGKIKLHDDGTYNFSLQLKFQPQQYFEIGTIISLAFVFFVFSYLLYNFSQNMYNRHKK